MAKQLRRHLSDGTAAWLTCRQPCAAGDAAAWRCASRRWRGRISGRARAVAVASTLFLAARRAAQLTFPCGAFVFFLGAFNSIFVLVAIVRSLFGDFVRSAGRSGT